MQFTDEMKELEAIVKANKERANQIMGIGSTDNTDTVKQVTREEALEIGRLNKETHEALKRMDELMKGA